MKDKRSLHLKVQEMCDCFATTDPLKEMSEVKDDADKLEAALKWIGLAALHGVNFNAKKVSITKAKDGTVKVTAKYREAELPSPGPEAGHKVIEVVREIAHIEGEKGELPLALGIRDSSVELNLKVKSEEGEEKLTIEFSE
ncbi:MAG: hypothetical protein JRI88_01260 [Deltaproteobacteria bacterium]|nr:hypothetical protein [Deltaproteobacteria bacterium]